MNEHGAAVVALTIDEEGRACTAEWKVAVASRLIDDLTSNWGHVYPAKTAKLSIRTPARSAL